MLHFRKLRREYSLALIASLSLVGCFEKPLDPRFKNPPTSIAASITFEDKMQGDPLGGKIFVTRSTADNDASSYIVRWGSNGMPAQTDPSFPSNFIHRFEITGGYTEAAYEHEIYIETPPPAGLGIDSIMVFTANTAGENSIGLAVPLINVINIPLAPALHPAAVTFTDSDDRVTIAGTITFEAASDESVIDFYKIRFAGASGCPLQDDAIATIARDEPYSYTLPTTTPKTSARSIVVIAGNEYGEAAAENCVDYSHSNSAAFNKIMPSTTPKYAANRVLLDADSDDSDNLTTILRIQGSIDERDLSTGYYVNLLNDSTGACSTRLAYFPKTGNKQWHTFEFDRWTIPANTSSLLVSTGTECGFAGNEPIAIPLDNLRGNWHLIKSGTSGRCIRAEDSEPVFPDNDGLSSDLRLATCDEYDDAQRFTVSNLWISDDPNGYVIHRVSSTSKGGCLWRRNNTDQQEWQLKKNCDGSEGTSAEIQIMARNDANGRRDKTMAVRNFVDPNWQYSCAGESDNRLISSWNNCGSSPFGSGPAIFNFAPAGTLDESRYAVFYDAP